MDQYRFGFGGRGVKRKKSGLPSLEIVREVHEQGHVTHFVFFFAREGVVLVKSEFPAFFVSIKTEDIINCGLPRSREIRGLGRRRKAGKSGMVGR